MWLGPFCGLSLSTWKMRALGGGPTPVLGAGEGNAPGLGKAFLPPTGPAHQATRAPLRTRPAPCGTGSGRGGRACKMRWRGGSTEHTGEDLHGATLASATTRQPGRCSVISVATLQVSDAWGSGCVISVGPHSSSTAGRQGSVSPPQAGLLLGSNAGSHHLPLPFDGAFSCSSRGQDCASQWPGLQAV